MDSTPHAWCQMDYNGITYIFDPEVEDVIANSQGYIMYIRFGGTTGQLVDMYHFSNICDDFSRKAAGRGYDDSEDNGDEDIDEDFWDRFFDMDD